jgi:tetratricopeptide (TPR) repeat protein
MVSAPLAAQLTGRITGKVTDAAGKPVQGAVIVLKRTDIAFVKELKTNDKGVYIQAGLEPREYLLTLSAEGYVGVKETIKIPLNAVLVRDLTLLTADQMTAQAGLENSSGVKAAAGNTAYTQAVGLYNDKNYAGAVPMFESAIEQYAEAIAKAAKEDSVAEARQFHASALDLLADCWFEVGMSEPDQRGALWPKAEPALKGAFDKLPSDDRSPERARLAYQLGEIAKTRGDSALAKKYNDILEKLEGPKVENSYNAAVALYNAGKLAEAKPHLKKAIEIKPSFAETYYLLAFCELNGGDMKAAKACFQKYLELDPNGKYAAEVKEFLADL